MTEQLRAFKAGDVDDAERDALVDELIEHDRTAREVIRRLDPEALPSTHGGTRASGRKRIPVRVL